MEIYDPIQANSSAKEIALKDKEAIKKIKPPKMDYPIRIDKKTVIFPSTKKRFEMLSRTYPDGTCKLGKQ